MALPHTLEITVLGNLDGSTAFASARLGSQVMFGSIPDPATIQQLLEMRDRLQDCVHGRQAITELELEEYGKKLGEVLLRGPIGDLYAIARAKGVRIALIINECKLDCLPWEYLHGPTDMPGPQSNRTVVRIVSSGQDAGNTITARPAELKVLLLVSSDPQDTIVPSNDLTATIRKTFQAWIKAQNVKLEICSAPSIKSFSDAVNQGPEAWDVVHYLGHGEVRTIGGEEVGGLLLCGDKKQEFMTARRLATLLQARPPRLVILSACSTANAEYRFQFANLAKALARKNIPAVIANQMVITADSIASFCNGVYQKLLSTGDVDEAVTQGRLLSYTELVPDNDDTARVEWGVPVLYRHLGAQQIFS